MTKTTPGDVLTVHCEPLQAFFQTCVVHGAISDDTMNAIFAMTAERLRNAHHAAEDSGAFAYLNQFVQNVRLFGDGRDQKLS